MAQDLFYYETGYIDESYFVYIADAEAALAASSSIACDADVIAGGVIVEGSSSWMSDSSVTTVASVILDGSTAMSSAFTQSAMISHIEGADLFAMSNAALAADVARIRDNNIAASSAFTIATDASRTRHYSSDESADFTIAVANLRVRYSEAATSAAFSLTADLTRQPGVSVDASGTWASEFTFDCQAQRKRNIVDFDVTTEFTQTATAERLAGLSSQFEVVSFITNTSDRIRNVVASLTPRFSTYSQNVAGTDDVIGFFFRPDMESYRQIQPGWSVVGNPTWIVTAVDHTVDYGQSSVITITGGQFVSGATYSFTIDDSAKTSLTAYVNETVQLAADLTATATVACTISHIEGADLTALSNCALAASITVTRNVVSAISVSSSITVDAVRTRNIISALTVINSLSVTVTRIKSLSSTLASAFTQTASVAKFTNFFTVEIQDQPDANNNWYSSPRGLYVDSNENMYSVGTMGYDSVSIAGYPAITKVNKFGEHQWTKTFVTTAANYFTNIVSDSSGNLYTAVDGSNTVIKYNTDGSVAWRYNTSNTSVQFKQIAIDSSDNLIAVGLITVSSVQYPYVIKINSSGIFQWNKRLSSGTRFTNVIVDGTNIYTSTRTAVIKLDSTGAHVWTRAISRNSTSITDVQSLSKDSSGNIYASCVNASGTPWRILVKIDSSGNKLWHRDYDSTIYETYDSGTDVFITTGTGSVGTIDPANGAVNWLKTYNPGETFYIDGTEQSLTVQNSGLYFTGLIVQSVSPYQYSNLILRLPTDGSGIPTVGTYTVSSINDTTTSTTSFNTTASSVVNLTGITLSANTNTLSTDTPTTTFNAVNPGGYTLSGAAAVTSTSTLTGSLNVLKLANAVISSSSSITAQPDNNLKSATASLSANGFIAVINGRIRPELADLSSAFSLEAVIGIQASAEANLTSNFSLSAQGRDLDLAQAGLASNFTLSASLTPLIFGGQANLTSTATINANVNENAYIVTPCYYSGFNASITYTGYEFNIGSSTDPYPKLVVDGNPLSVYISKAGSTYYVGISFNILVKLSANTWERRSREIAYYIPNTTFIESMGTGSKTFSITMPSAMTGLALPSGFSASIKGFDLSPYFNGIRTDPTVGPLTVKGLSGTTAVYYPFGSWVDPYPLASFVSGTITGYNCFDVTKTVAVATFDQSYFTVTANALRVKFGVISASSSFTQTITPNRFRNPGTKNLQTTFTLSNAARKIVVIGSNLNSTTSLTSPINRLLKGSLALQTNATMTINAVKTTSTQSQQESTVTLVANNVRTRRLSSVQSSEFSISENVSKKTTTSANFDAFVSTIEIVNKIGRGFIHMESQSTMAVTGVITADQPQYMFSQTQMTAQGINTLFGSAALTAASTFNLVPTYLRRNESVMTVTANAVINNSRTRNNSSTQLAQFFAFPSTDNSKVTGYAAALTSTSQIVTNNQILRLAQANLLSTSAMPLVFAGILVRFEANLQVNGFILSAAQILNIDEYYQLKIPSETRTLWIEPESRILSIDSETRVNKIKGYPTP